MKHVHAEHGIICRLPGERFSYFGWPSVARLDDGTLLAASSGLRSAHVCPWGKTVLHVSRDNGRTWSPSRVIQDSPIDDRDAGIITLGGSRVLVSWFRSDTRRYRDANWLSDAERTSWTAVLSHWTDEMVHGLLGSWVMLSDNAGASWGAPISVPVSSPHGPIQLANGHLLYLGKDFQTQHDTNRTRHIQAARSEDGGRTWEVIGTVPEHPGHDPALYHEPHAVALPSGRLVGMIRISGTDAAGFNHFSMLQTISDDGGLTWTPARPLGFHGSPPHLLCHSSGVLVLTYGYRLAPYGQRVAFSHDDGATWEHDWILRDDGPDGDLGYPGTVEMADGSLFSVYYQKAASGEKCSLLWSRWEMPRV